jgi:hypothetical protein
MTQTVVNIAQMFAQQLENVLTEEQFAEVLRRNTAEMDPGTCHSHDFCDANMVMASAFEDVMERPMVMNDTAQGEADRGLWNAAWDHATTYYLNDATKKVWVDKDGRRVAISRLGTGSVEFNTAGGGFSHRMLRDKFFETFREMTEPPTYRQGLVDADWMKDDERLACWGNGDLWNGWSKPFFERAAVDELIRQATEDGALMPMHWEGDNVIVIDMDEDTENQATRYAPTIMPNGEKAWDIGAGWWCWNSIKYLPTATAADFAPPAQRHYYDFTLNVKIHDPERLLAAAAVHEDGVDSKDELRDADGNVDIGKCLVILLDPGTLPGGEILGSSSNWETSHDI